MNQICVQPKRRLLFLLPFAPRLDALHGGSQASTQLIANLATRHAVAIICLRAVDDSPVDQILQDRCEVVEEIIRPYISNSLAGQSWYAMRVFHWLIRGKPRWATRWSVEEYGAGLRTLSRIWEPDIVQIETHIMGQYLSALDDCPAPRVLHVHEPGTKALLDLRSSHRGLKRMLDHIDMLAWERFEKGIIRDVQAVVVLTERDRHAIMPLAGLTPIVRIPLGMHLPERPFNPLGCLPMSLLFFGSFIHPPNIDAAIRLIDKIFPGVQSRIPGVALYIVGDQPPSRIWKMANEHVTVTGRVPDVMPYLDQAALVVIPLRLGGGMRIKVLEALSAGKAVIASPLAIEGLNLVDGEQVILAESDEQFRNAIIDLLGNPERRAAIAARARAWASANLVWENSIAAYETLYEKLIARSGAKNRSY